MTFTERIGKITIWIVSLGVAFGGAGYLIYDTNKNEQIKKQRWTDRQSEIKEDGRLAALKGIGAESCPFSNELDVFSWKSGHIQGQLELKEKK